MLPNGCMVPEKEQNEVEMSNLHNKELKLMTIKWLRRKTDKHREQFNKEVPNKTTTALKNTLEGLNSRVDELEK